MIQELLQYQETDGKLKAIEQELSTSEERKKYMTARKFLEKAPEKLDALDAKANELKHIFDQLVAKYKEIEDTIQEYANVDEMVEQGADLSFYKKNASQIMESVKALRAEIAKLESRIEAAKTEYATAKKQTIAMQKQYKEYKVKYAELKDSRAAEMKSIEGELSKIAKKIPAELLEKYTLKRKEKLFPVVCEVQGNRCPQCGIELSVSEISKLADGSFVECDSCRRVLFKQS